MIARPGNLFACAFLALISTIPLWVMGALGSGMLTPTGATVFCNDGEYEDFRGVQEELSRLAAPASTGTVTPNNVCPRSSTR